MDSVDGSDQMLFDRLRSESEAQTSIEQQGPETVPNRPEMEAALAVAVFGRMASILSEYASGYFVFHSVPLDEVYIRLRQWLMTALATLPCFDNLDRTSFESALPASLGEFTEAATVGVWEEMSFEILRLKGELLSALIAAEVTARPADADEAVGRLGHDEMLAGYKAEKRRLTEQACRRLNIPPPWSPEPWPAGSTPCPQHGRHRRRSSERRARARTLDEKGLTRKEIAKELGVSERYVYSLLAEQSDIGSPS